ncbi:S-adenosyl-L-methionine-dependent methyltransferase [Roridomyces roridus]|uniref:S-adenosyl-L-methionine-dependent methyltransferase n=1 Tax=Roridomyces roridus TaxID=1738132 RepID=A0AAD7B9S8_9AGAR|nr:S-adenosyl-L-methionine-dependent methyltransferase [Roridomyces roridus]
MSSSAFATLPVSSLPQSQSGSWFQRAWLAHGLFSPVVALPRHSFFVSSKHCLVRPQEGITTGILELTDPSAVVHKFGVQDKDVTCETRRAVLQIHNDGFWVRLYITYDVGFSEAYMAGECDSPDMKQVLNLFVDNYTSMGAISTIIDKFYQAFNVVYQHFSHSRVKSIANIAIYDTSNTLYQAFLSTEMQYSCPIWSEAEDGVNGDLHGKRRAGDLEAAQANRINYTLRKARVHPACRLLDIGGGWGSVAIAAAKLGCTVDSLTLSIEQKELAEKRIKEAGFSEQQIRVHLMDYRDMPDEFKGAFDACVSLEMLEAVGQEYWSTYTNKIDWALKDKNAAVVVTAASYPENTYTLYQGTDFIRKFHWPHAILPSALSLAHDFCTAPKGRFCIDSIEDFGTHYPRCLREWDRRLEENWTPFLIDTVILRYPELKDPYKLEMFRRKWHYMFMYLEVAYSRVWLSCYCWTFVRPEYSASLRA